MIQLSYPTKDYVVTQKYKNKSANYKGGYHIGTDIRLKNDPNRSVFAIAEGSVIKVDTTSDFNWFRPGSWGKGSPYGNHIIIKHVIEGEIYFSLYAHLSDPKVRIGDTVASGELIAVGGNTGMSTADHLHLELRKDRNLLSRNIDPAPFFMAAIVPVGREDLPIPDWAEQAVAWVERNELFEITSQTDIRDAVKFHRLYKLIKN